MNFLIYPSHVSRDIFDDGHRYVVHVFLCTPVESSLCVCEYFVHPKDAEINIFTGVSVNWGAPYSETPYSDPPMYSWVPYSDLPV